jgi:hypothetical protein
VKLILNGSPEYLQQPHYPVVLRMLYLHFAQPGAQQTLLQIKHKVKTNLHDVKAQLKLAVPKVTQTGNKLYIVYGHFNYFSTEKAVSYVSVLLLRNTVSDFGR